jgi:hypothetical protein
MEPEGEKQQYSVNVPQLQGVQIGDYGTQTNMFLSFAQAPTSLSSHIRTLEFRDSGCRTNEELCGP